MDSNNTPLKIVVADSSAILRSGVAAVLKRLPGLNIQPVEIATSESLRHYLQLHRPQAVIVSPTLGGWLDLPALKAEGRNGEARYVALVSTVIDPAALRGYDAQISICDDPDAIADRLDSLLRAPGDEPRDVGPETLSQREKEIVTCVVKGMTNKAIADRLCLSIHTIITHRRNIARKLQIHSSAGLTIYAIVNKLVELGDIKDQL